MAFLLAPACCCDDDFRRLDADERVEMSLESRADLFMRSVIPSSKVAAAAAAAAADDAAADDAAADVDAAAAVVVAAVVSVSFSSNGTYIEAAL